MCHISQNRCHNCHCIRMGRLRQQGTPCSSAVWGRSPTQSTRSLESLSQLRNAVVQGKLLRGSLDSWACEAKLFSQIGTKSGPVCRLSRPRALNLSRKELECRVTNYSWFFTCCLGNNLEDSMLWTDSKNAELEILANSCYFCGKYLSVGP